MSEDVKIIEEKVHGNPERRIFHIDVGTLSELKVKEYLRDCMDRYRNRLVEVE